MHLHQHISREETPDEGYPVADTDAAAAVTSASASA